MQVSSTTSAVTVQISDANNNPQDTDFLINIRRASNDYKNPSATAAVPSQRTVFIKETQAANTQGGTATSGSYQTRTLNNISGNTSFASISGNQITLQPGLYNIEANAPAFKCDQHKTRLRNITDSATLIVGSSTSSSTADNTPTNAHLYGQFEITDVKVLELQHRVVTTRATDGFGVASNLVEDEVYTQIVINKLR